MTNYLPDKSLPSRLRSDILNRHVLRPTSLLGRHTSSLVTASSNSGPSPEPQQCARLPTCTTRAENQWRCARNALPLGVVVERLVALSPYTEQWMPTHGRDAPGTTVVSAAPRRVSYQQPIGEFHNPVGATGRCYEGRAWWGDLSDRGREGRVVFLVGCVSAMGLSTYICPRDDRFCGIEDTRSLSLLAH